MFGSIGMPELIVIFVIALIIFGPRKLPELGRALGRTINEVKKASKELRSTLEDEAPQHAGRQGPPRRAEKPSRDGYPCDPGDSGADRGARGAGRAER